MKIQIFLQMAFNLNRPESRFVSSVVFMNSTRVWNNYGWWKLFTIFFVKNCQYHELEFVSNERLWTRDIDKPFPKLKILVYKLILRCILIIYIGSRLSLDLWHILCYKLHNFEKNVRAKNWLLIGGLFPKETLSRDEISTINFFWNLRRKLTRFFYTVNLKHVCERSLKAVSFRNSL